MTGRDIWGSNSKNVRRERAEIEFDLLQQDNLNLIVLPGVSTHLFGS
jgi:hypothetical protein